MDQVGGLGGEPLGQDEGAARRSGKASSSEVPPREGSGVASNVLSVTSSDDSFEMMLCSTIIIIILGKKR